MKNYTLLLLIMFSFFSCMFIGPPRSDNYFYTKLFDFADIATDQKVNHIHIVNDTLGFLLATDEPKVRSEGGTIKDQSAILFRTVDGGKSFEKQILGKGILSFIGQAADGSSFYMRWGRFTEYQDLNPGEWVILRSSDLGKSWEEVYVFKDKYVTDVLFLDQKKGFCFVLQDPIGYDVETLYKTEDGGRTWKLLPINIDDLKSPTITKDGKILGLYFGDSKPAYWQMDVDDLKINRISLQNIPDDLKIYNRIQTDTQTGFHYINLANMDTNVDYLYCLETSALLKVPSPCYYFNVYGDYIGIASAWDQNHYINQYHYSTDKGKTWHTETQPGSYPVNPIGLYGKGQLWMMCMSGNHIKYPLMVRILPKENKFLENDF